jgi:hypothetical protein
MKITTRIQNNLKQRVRLLSKQYRLKTAEHLTVMAARVRKAEQSEMIKSLDRPTPFTVRGVIYTPAKPRTLTATVYIRPLQAKYLIHQVEGRPGLTAKPVPSSTTANKYGNLPRRASKRKGVYSIRGRSGKRYIVQRRSKRKSILIATWSTRRKYIKGKFDFYGVVAKIVRKNIRGFK